MKLPKKVKNKPYDTQKGRALLRKWKFAALDQILSAQKINASRQTAVACIKRPRVESKDFIGTTSPRSLK